MARLCRYLRAIELGWVLTHDDIEITLKNQKKGIISIHYYLFRFCWRIGKGDLWKEYKIFGIWSWSPSESALYHQICFMHLDFFFFWGGHNCIPKHRTSLSYMTYLPTLSGNNAAEAIDDMPPKDAPTEA